MINPLVPVYPGYLADPFVFRAPNGLYYAVGTGPQEGGRHFPLLRSADLETWEAVGGALLPLDNPALGTEFWAPEVAVGDDGRFYMYYSVGLSGNGGHQLRVAIADLPEGPYTDTSDPSLVPFPACPFAIDAHPFRDGDGQWYLFYARDFLDTDNGFRAGTGLVVDRMVSMTRLADEETVVMRARHDWQVYQHNRRLDAYGGRVFEWHTLEGASVMRHDGLYYCFYSGAAYQTDRYGVDYVVADHPMGPWRETGGADGPRVLRTLPDVLRGPGHNSVVTAPDGQEYVVFHAWDAGFHNRLMHLAPLVWTPDGPRTGLA